MQNNRHHNFTLPVACIAFYYFHNIHQTLSLLLMSLSFSYTKQASIKWSHTYHYFNTEIQTGFGFIKNIKKPFKYLKAQFYVSQTTFESFLARENDLYVCAKLSSHSLIHYQVTQKLSGSILFDCQCITQGYMNVNKKQYKYV